MERESNPMQPMCRSGCGFYGNPATDGLCSVCYKDSLRKKQQPPVGSTPVSVPSPQPSPTFSPAITIPSAAQPTVQSLQQQHNEIKEIMAKDFTRQSEISNTEEAPQLNETSETANSSNEVPSTMSRQLDEKLQIAITSSCSTNGSNVSTKRFKFVKKKLPTALNEDNIPKTFNHSLSTIKEEHYKKLNVSEESPANKSKRVGFMRLTNTTSSEANADTRNQQIKHFLHHQKSCDPSQVVNAAKILTNPQQGQVPPTNISVATIKTKSPKRKSINGSGCEAEKLLNRKENPVTGEEIIISAIKKKHLEAKVINEKNVENRKLNDKDNTAIKYETQRSKTVYPRKCNRTQPPHVQLRYVAMTGKRGTKSNGNEEHFKKSQSSSSSETQGKNSNISQEKNNALSSKNGETKDRNSSSSDNSVKNPNSSISQKDNEQEKNVDNSSSSLCRSATKRKINEENTAKTSSEAAASASAGPSTSTEPAEDDKDKDDDKDSKKKKNRCSECRKKVGLTGFLCRCGGLYCAVHRYSDKHNCTFDYREHGAQEIRRNNPVVVGEKIQKI